MKTLKSKVAIYAIISVFMGGVAWATTPAADYKTVTSKAYVDSLISDSDISSHTVNGAALSNEASYFYGTSSTAADQAIKDVTVTGLATPGANDHPIIVVQPEHTSTLALISGTPEFKLRLNSDAAADAKPVYVNGAPLDIKSQGSVWNENYPSAFVFDGTNWVFLGAGYNINTVIESYKVNGAPLRKTGTFYGTSSTVATTGAKTVTINGFPTTGYTPVAGQIIVVSPTITSTYDGAHTLSVNSSTAVPIYYNGAAVTDAATAAMVWTANVPTTFVYESTDGGKWVFAGHGVDTMIPAGTADDVVTYSGTAGVTGSRGVLSTLDTTQNGLIGGYNDTFSGNTSTWTVDPQTDIGTGSWAASEASKLVSVQAFAKGLAKKQNQIAATSSNLTFDNTNPQSAQAKSAGYSVVTTSGVAGNTGQIGVANEALYVTSNNETTLVNGEWIPNIYAVESMANSATSGAISDISDINDRVVNGMPFNNDSTPLQFAGTEDTTGITGASYVRVVSIPALPPVGGITDWTVIVVQPGITAYAGKNVGAFDTYGLNLAINDGQESAPILYNGVAVTDATAPIVWNQNYPSIFVFYSKAGKDGAWLFAGSGNEVGAELMNNTVNGAPLSNASSYYYGTGTASATGITVTIPSIASTANTLPGTGQIIVVQPTNPLGNYACNTTDWKLTLNSFTAANVAYGTQKLSCNQNADEERKRLVWDTSLPSMFVFNGTNWVFLGHGFDENTEYGALNSDASGNWSGPAGTGTDAGVISPKTLKNSIHRVNLTANSGTTAWTATNSRMTTSDTMLGALGKAQGQIDNRQTLVPATGTYKTLSGTTWTSTSISDYDAAGVKGTSLPTKTGTEGNLGERMIVDSGTDTTGWATAKLANAIPSMSKISAITASMQSQKVCYEYKPGTGANPTDADCWLWRLP